MEDRVVELSPGMAVTVGIEVGHRWIVNYPSCEGRLVPLLPRRWLALSWGF
jgi:hypothetical protein